MPHSRPTLALICGLVLACTPGRAAVLLHEYALRGSLTDTTGENTLTAFGGDITALGYVFAANAGVTFSSRAFTPTDYSIEFSFGLATTSGVTKLLDFHNLTADAGLYSRGGSLSFDPGAASTGPDFAAGTNVHVVLTRDAATNLVVAYVNGEQRFSFHDDLSLAATPGFSNKLSFFVNDSNEPNASGGTLNYLRVFNGALSAGEVSLLYSAGPPNVVPEPPALVLVGMGAILALATRFGKRRLAAAEVPTTR